MGDIIPQPTVERLCRLHRLLKDCTDKKTLSSSDLARLTGTRAHTIRKDLSCFDSPEAGGSGYPVAELRDSIADLFNLNSPRKACVVGLGRLGSAILRYPGFGAMNIALTAGFDRSVNRIETLSSEVPLHPSYKIDKIVRREEISLGILAVPPEAAQESADRLIAGGIRGLVNFAPAFLSVPEHIFVRNLYVGEELQILSAMIELDT